MESSTITLAVKTSLPQATVCSGLVPYRPRSPFSAVRVFPLSVFRFKVRDARRGAGGDTGAAVGGGEGVAGCHDPRYGVRKPKYGGMNVGVVER